MTVSIMDALFPVRTKNLHALFRLYNVLWKPVLPVLKRHHRLAEGFSERTLVTPPPACDFWIQAASVGEANLAGTLLRSLLAKRSVNVLATSGTAQGVETLLKIKQRLLSDYPYSEITVTYFPFDKPSIMQAAVRRIAPKVMVILETELWPGLLLTLKESKCHTLIINGRMTQKSCERYKRWQSLWHCLAPKTILAISQADAMRFSSVFGDNASISVMNNIKFDQITFPDKHYRSTNPLTAFLPMDTPFAILGSVRQEEEPDITNILLHLRRKQPQAVIGLFPRHMHRIPFWKKTLSTNYFHWQLRSSTQQIVPPGSVVLWDTFGELTFAYAMAQSIFVGGSLAPLGGQNFLEALTSGIVPVIGPSWENFAWVGSAIIDQGLLQVAPNWRATADILTDMIKQPQSIEDTRKKARHYITNRQGGTAQACSHILAALDCSSMNNVKIKQ